MNKKFELLSKGVDIKIKEIGTCKYCSEEFPIFDLEKKLLNKHGFKNTEQCSVCIFRSLNSFLNDKHLYHRKDTKTEKDIISIFSEYFDGDVLEVRDYKKLILDDGGLDYSRDLTDDVFGEFLKLYKSFPRPSRLIYPELENSEYSSHVGWAKNVYLSYCVFVNCEDIYYSFRVVGGCKDVFSSFNVLGSSNIYSSSNLGSSYNIYFSNTVVNSSDLLFCEDMDNCIFCCNRVNSSYQIFNKQYSQEEYEEMKKEIYKKLNNKVELGPLLKKYKDFLKEKLIKLAIDMNRCEKSIGEDTYDSINCINSFFVTGLKDSVNVMSAGDEANDYMVNIINCIEAGSYCENCIGSCSFGVNVYNIFFSFGVVESSKNIYYCMDIDSCEECMFSVGLKGKKYCILNKEYSKEQYFIIKEKLITKLQSDGYWGEYLPSSLTGFPYNDTLAYDYFKVNKVIYSNGKEELIDEKAKGIVTLKTNDFISDAILDLGGKEKINIKWRQNSKEINIPQGSNVINGEDLPSINSVETNILSKIIICKESKRPFKIIKKELDFLKKKNLPLPTFHNELRIDKLVGIRGAGELSVGTCDKCKKECLTIFKEKPNYKVYCMDCYRKFMYN